MKVMALYTAVVRLLQILNKVQLSRECIRAHSVEGMGSTNPWEEVKHMMIGINERSGAQTKQIIEKVQNAVLDTISRGGAFCISIKEIDEKKPLQILKYHDPDDQRIEFLNDLQSWANAQKEISHKSLESWIKNHRVEIIHSKEYNHVAALKDIVDLIEGRYEGIRMFKETPRALRTGTSREANLMFDEVRIIKECMDITLEEYGFKAESTDQSEGP
jgi:hypothetical protein